MWLLQWCQRRGVDWGRALRNTWHALDFEYRSLRATGHSCLQAMADYAELITALKAELDAEDAAVIGFGGSYGALVCLVCSGVCDILCCCGGTKGPGYSLTRFSAL